MNPWIVAGLIACAAAVAYAVVGLIRIYLKDGK